MDFIRKVNSNCKAQNCLLRCLFFSLLVFIPDCIKTPCASSCAFHCEHCEQNLVNILLQTIFAYWLTCTFRSPRQSIPQRQPILKALTFCKLLTCTYDSELCPTCYKVKCAKCACTIRCTKQKMLANLDITAFLATLIQKTHLHNFLEHI